MKKKGFWEVEGGITAVPGFLASGVCAGIKRQDRPDVAVLFSRKEAVTAGVFTTSRVCAAPVQITRDRIKGGRIQAVVINSGNANACTGKKGYQDVLEMTRQVADCLGIDEQRVCAASTGVIGQRLPMDRIAAVIPEAVHGLSLQGGQDAARAIMTTDTFPKEAAMRGRLGGREVTIGGIAKGSGMIAPKMATMLSFITTDMKIGRASLHKILRDAADVSFNRITVDGDTSTNDTVLCMANGLSETTAESAVLEGFREMLIQVTTRLAKMIVMDGEGATKLVEIRVTGARSTRDAGLAAFAIANSSLVKTTFFGEDPNWGRIMAAIGYSGAVIQEDRIAISFEGVPVARKGMGLGGDLENQAREVMRRREFVLSVDLGMGKGETVVWTSDLSYDYVKINVAYRS